MSALIGHSRPASPTWALVGTGASFDTDPQALSDSAVTNRTAIVWLSGSQTTSTLLKLQSTFAIAQVPRIIPILGLVGIPAGTKIVVKGKRAGDSDFTYNLGGNSQSQRTFAFPDGSIGAWIICDAGLDPIIGYQVAIYNDVNGSTYFTASQYIYPGEIDLFQGWETPYAIERDWNYDADGLPIDRRSAITNQSDILVTLPFRTLDVTLAAADYATTYGTAATSSAIDYDELSTILQQGDVCCAIPRWQDNTGALDAWALHRSALYGVARKVGKPQATGGNYFRMQLGFAEIPPGTAST